MDTLPKVLVISHNCFSQTNNMGKTLADMLSCLPPDNLAQLYFSPEVPTLSMCCRYFRVTDMDILARRRGNVMDLEKRETVPPAVQELRNYARRRTPLIYFARNLLWQTGPWDSPALESWLLEFQPEVVLFAAGDYVFSYRIADKIADKYGLPVIMWCCDDHFLSKKPHGSLLYHFNRCQLLHWARRIGKKTKQLIVISDKMATDYAALFPVPIHVLRISAPENPWKTSQRKGIVYAGNLGIGRIEPLLSLAQTLKAGGIPGYDRIHVYSGEQSRQALLRLTEENGIIFHGAVPADDLAKILGAAKFLVHVESFEDGAKRRTRYSLSTKIGESLQSGACILAYGPEDISSMEYLREHKAAYILAQAQDALKAVAQLLMDDLAYQAIVQNGAALARKHHSREQNEQIMGQILAHAISEGSR